MNAGQLLFIVRDIIALLVSGAILKPDGTFDSAKLATLQQDLAFAEQIEHVLAVNGLHVPDRLEKILQILPLVAALVG